MALKFGESKGSAVKDKVPQYTYKNGDQTVRIVSDLLPRYVYWIKGDNNKDIPMECLAFDRSKEKFTNQEKDWVKEYYPDLKCGWAYACQIIDPADGTDKVMNLKKKLLEQIMTAAEDLGDPTDPDNGWDITFRKVKTGPQTYNVEYQLMVLKCKKRALTDEEKAVVANMKNIDELLPRPTPDAQKELLERIQRGSLAKQESGDTDQGSVIPGDVESELDLT
jgi:hypothetical protein